MYLFRSKDVLSEVIEYDFVRVENELVSMIGCNLSRVRIDEIKSMSVLVSIAQYLASSSIKFTDHTVSQLT